MGTGKKTPWTHGKFHVATEASETTIKRRGLRPLCSTCHANQNEQGSKATSAGRRTVCRSSPAAATAPPPTPPVALASPRLAGDRARASSRRPPARDHASQAHHPARPVPPPFSLAAPGSSAHAPLS